MKKEHTPTIFSEAFQKGIAEINYYAAPGAKKYTPYRLGIESGVNQPTVSRILSGESKNPERENVNAIARTLTARFKELGIIEKAKEFRKLYGEPDLEPYLYDVKSMTSGSSGEPAEGLDLIAVAFVFETMQENRDYLDMEAGPVDKLSRIFEMLYRFYGLTLAEGRQPDPQSTELSTMIKLNR